MRYMMVLLAGILLAATVLRLVGAPELANLVLFGALMVCGLVIGAGLLRRKSGGKVE